MTARMGRRAFLGSISTGVGLALAGCSSLSICNDEGEQIEVGDDVETVTYVGDEPPENEPADSPPFADRVLPLPTTPEAMEEAADDGGPGQDGIPSIDEPEFVSPDETTGLDEDSVVFGVERGGEAKAYPRGVLVQHEIVNDTIDRLPVSVTYCPLTGTAQGFERGDTTFGVSGMLVNNNLIMYDREAERWWPQIGAASIPGPWHDTSGGATLREFEVIRTTLGQWQSVYPETVVLSRETSYARDYDRDPYEPRGYYEDDDTIFGNIYENDRFHAKRWVYGARTEEGAAAFTQDLLHEGGLVEAELGETPVVAVHDERFDTAWLYRNPDRVNIEHDGVQILVDGTAHPPDELPLDRIICFDAYWFAWIAYYPNTGLYE